MQMCVHVVGGVRRCGLSKSFLSSVTSQCNPTGEGCFTESCYHQNQVNDKEQLSISIVGSILCLLAIIKLIEFLKGFISCCLSLPLAQ